MIRHIHVASLLLEMISGEQCGTWPFCNCHFIFFKITVEIKVTFLKINDIDTVDQKFQAEIFVTAKWHDPLIKGDEKVILKKPIIQTHS